MPLGLASVLMACGGAPADGPPPSQCPPVSEACAAKAPVPDDIVDPWVHRARAPGDTFIEILDLEVSGDYVFACTGTQGLTIWNIADPNEPRLVAEEIGPPAADDRFPRCQHLAIDAAAERLVLTSRGDEVQKVPFLWVYDIADPVRPEPVTGWVSDGPSIEGVALRGNRIWAAAHGAGILGFEDRGGSLLAELGAFADDESDAWFPVWRGDHLFVAEGPTGVRAYSVAGDAPELLGHVPFDGSSRDLIIKGDRAFVATSSGIGVVDVSDPAAIRSLGWSETLGTSLAIAEGPGTTVLIAEWDEVRGYDVSDPVSAMPLWAERLPTTSDFSRVLALATDSSRTWMFGGEWEGLHAVEYVGGQGPEIELAPAVMDFGDLPEGEVEDRVLVIRNTGTTPLRVHEVVRPEGVSVSRTCFSVEPGASAAVELSYISERDEPTSEWLEVCSNDADEPGRPFSLVANTPGLGVGDPAPDFALTDLDGEVWESSQLRGNIVVLAYFATF